MQSSRPLLRWLRREVYMQGIYCNPRQMLLDFYPFPMNGRVQLPELLLVG